MAIEQIPIDQNSAFRASINNADTKVDINSSVEINKVAFNKAISSETEGFMPLNESKDKSILEKSQLLNEEKRLEQKALADEEKNSEQSKEEVEQVLEVINQFIPLKNTNLIFEFDDISDPPIVKVVDKNTEEIIREIPPKNIRKIAQAFNDMADSISKTGALFKSEV